MSLINITNLTFSYEGSYLDVFKDTSFQIDTDWKLGFVGRNGRGKTTFLKLLTGEYKYSGTISSNVQFEYFTFNIADSDRLTIEILQEIVPMAEQWEIIRETNLLDVNPEVLYNLFSTLSAGERTKVMLGALFLKENTFFLIDEPTNHLDIHGREVLAEYLKKKKGFIIVSHDRSFLDECIDHVISINKQNIEIIKGNYESFSQTKIKTEKHELSENDRIKKEIRHLKIAAGRTQEWSASVEKSKKGVDAKVTGLRPDRGAIGHKAAKMMKRSKVMERRIDSSIDEKEELLKNIETKDTLKLFPLTYHKNPLLTLDNVSINYGERTVLEGLDFSIRSGERINLSGGNGTGKSSILKLITGETINFTGTINVPSGLIISYVSQETGHLKGTVKEYAKERDIAVNLFISVLRKLDIGREQLDEQMDNFSEGQKKKVLIAGSLCTKAHLYIWDEPLNYIDIISREQIEELILKAEPTMIFVEHDKTFCDTIASRKVVL
ncbi:MAG: ribosomal protection-like ABC-F family protein [Suipraeoptans sp.]